MLNDVKTRSAALFVAIVPAALLAAWGIVDVSFPAPTHATSLLALAAASGIAALASYRARPRCSANRASESAKAEQVPLQVGPALSVRAACERSVRLSPLPLALLAAGTLSAEADTRKNVVMARGNGIAIASVCSGGQYMLLVTKHPEAEPWKKALRATLEADRVAIALRFEDKAEDGERLLYRISGLPGVWSFPNGRTYTGSLESVSVPQDLYVRVWLPGEDRSGPGHLIPGLTQETVARMWLNALTCSAPKQQ